MIHGNHGGGFSEVVRTALSVDGNAKGMKRCLQLAHLDPFCTSESGGPPSKGVTNEPTNQVNAT